jgi:hypothetical protein
MLNLKVHCRLAWWSSATQPIMEVETIAKSFHSSIQATSSCGSNNLLVSTLFPLKPLTIPIQAYHSLLPYLALSRNNRSALDSYNLGPASTMDHEVGPQKMAFFHGST